MHTLQHIRLAISAIFISDMTYNCLQDEAHDLYS